MTYNDLIYQVDLLAGQSIEEEGLVLASANRALRDLFNRVKVTKTARLAAHGLRPTTYIKEINCINGQPYTVQVEGLAYSMRVHGSGRIMVSYGDVNNVERVDSMYESTLVKGFLPGLANITFWGSFSFTIYDFSIYDQNFSEERDEIPECGPTVTLDLRKIYGDFMSFVTPALDRDGNPIKNCALSDGRLVVDSEYKGEIFLTYRRLPTAITGEDDEILDIPEEYTHLFPLLVAHHATLSSNEAMAKYYKTLYEDSLELLERTSYNRLDCSYPVTNGWA